MHAEVTTSADLVRSFVNTLDREDGVDVLDRGWLVDQGLVGLGGELEPGAIGRLAALREAIRDLLLANNGVSVDVTAAMAVLDETARRAGLTVRFRPDGTASLEPAAGGTERVSGRIVAAVAELMGTEAWIRLKACRWDDCRWAFFDTARNRTRTWCSMAACGNRAKARAFRARQGHSP